MEYAGESPGDGLKNRTAWAGVGDGVLFYDAGNDGQITQDREFVFTEWDPTAKDDMAALRSRFDSNGDGRLTSADDDWGKFKVMVTGPDGTQSAPRDVGRAFIAHLCLIHHSTRLRP